MRAQVAALWERYRERLEAGPRAPGASSLRWRTFRWLLEELQVSLFAQELRTPCPCQLQTSGKGLDGVIRR